jgi:hypothetical protein
LSEISRLEESEFPYEDPRFALLRIKGRFVAFQEQLNSLQDDAEPEVLKDVANTALDSLVRYLPILGFILRSTNVRNGFELVGPLRRLARQLLQADATHGAKGAAKNEQVDVHLLLSSEWEYMPLFHSARYLPGYVMIGLPAHESSNPLLFPLCGHELGHALWANGRESQYSILLTGTLNDEFSSKWDDIKKAFPQFSGHTSPPTGIQNTLFRGSGEGVSFPEVVALVTQWATKQAEETFCDFVGLRLFGRAYYLAFTHILFPGNIGKRLPVYPNSDQRAGYMHDAIKHFKYPEDGVDVSVFDRRADWELPSDRLLMGFADNALKSMIPKLLADADETANRAGIPRVDEGSVERVLARYKHAVPVQGESLPAILGAGWRVFENENFWQYSPHLTDNRVMVLKELMLKNIELIEVEEIQKRADRHAAKD